LQIVRERHLLPLIDFAYQGFGDGLEQDAWAVRLFAAELPEVLITSSCSKTSTPCRHSPSWCCTPAATTRPAST
jgi:aspartate/tyrosine/aromatic aminotransferase